VAIESAHASGEVESAEREGVTMTHTRDDKPVIIIERSGGGLGGFLVGLLIGAGAALLLAPQSGEETREQLVERGKKLRDDARSRAEDLRDRVEDGYERAKERLEDGLDSARSTFREKRVGAHDALDAGKAAVHSARDELERRLAEARAGRKESEPEEAETT
jgi:gas vesicle protein